VLVAKWLTQGDHAEVLDAVARHKASIKRRGMQSLEIYVWKSCYFDERRERVLMWEMDGTGFSLVAGYMDRRSGKKKGKLFCALCETEYRLRELAEEALRP
jgi:hypothetical protein